MIGVVIGGTGSRVDPGLEARNDHRSTWNCSTTWAYLTCTSSALLVPVDQLLDRRRQVLVGGDHRDQLADVEPALERQIAADRVEQERRHLGEEIVEELDEEFPLIEVVADLEDAPQPGADVGALVVRRVVDMDGGNAVDDLADPAGELAGGELALRGRASIRRRRSLGMMTPWTATIAAGHEAEPEILHQDEDQSGERLAAEQRRLDEGIADEAAERLDLILDHGGDFGRLHALELAGREAQHAVDELVAQAPQHALAEAALVGIDVELEEAVDDDEQQEDAAQRHQHLEAVELEARRRARALPDELIQCGMSKSMRRKVWVALLAFRSRRPWIGPLTICFGRSKDMK